MDSEFIQVQEAQAGLRTNKNPSSLQDFSEPLALYPAVNLQQSRVHEIQSSNVLDSQPHLVVEPLPEAAQRAGVSGNRLWEMLPLGLCQELMHFLSRAWCDGICCAGKIGASQARRQKEERGSVRRERRQRQRGSRVRRKEEKGEAWVAGGCAGSYGMGVHEVRVDVARRQLETRGQTLPNVLHLTYWRGEPLSSAT
jgi:hypothetical protein